MHVGAALGRAEALPGGLRAGKFRFKNRRSSLQVFKTFKDVVLCLQ